MNLKVGLTNNIDFQVVLESYLLSYSSSMLGKTDSKGGFGDTTARLKINLWGNDEKTAFGLIPFLKIPTNTFNSNKYFEGGVIFPAQFDDLPLDFSLGAMLVWNYARNEETNSYNNTLISSVTVGHDLIEKLSGYVELYSDKNLHNNDWIVTFDSGLNYLITENLKFDCGVNWGLTKEADDINPFIGISARL